MRKLASLLGKWPDPHGAGMMKELSQISSITVEEGHVRLQVTPGRPHCACCLFDLVAMRDNISQTKGVNTCEIAVTGIPAADRWTRALR